MIESTQFSSTRRNDLDWLRVIAFALLILFHTGMMFNTWDWHVKNNVTSETLEYFMRFLNQWRMPLLFFISGAVIWYALDRYRTLEFLWERHTRLLLPLVFGMIVVVPPQLYFERLFQGQQFDSFGSFYQTILELRPYPAGNLTWHHLWYIPYIFVYSLLALPVFAYLKRTGSHLRAARYFSTWWSIVLLFLPVAVSEISLRPFWPSNANNLIGDWAQFTSTFIIFVLGFLMAGQKETWDMLAENRRKYLTLALILLPLMYFFWYFEWAPNALGYAVYRSFRSLHLWLWIITMLAFGRKFLNVHSRFLKYANQAVYPFYILHQTIIVVAGYHMASWDIPWPVKFVLLACLTFAVSWLLYEYLIRRIRILRPLFGLKMNS